MPATFSITTLVTLFAILAVSGRVFHVLCKQWTHQRPIQALRDWASDRRFTFQLPHDATLPAALDGLKPLDARIELLMQNKSTTLIRLTTATRTTNPRPVWHLLIRETHQASNPAGLRPVHAARSFLDLFTMQGYPSLLPPDRFVAFGTDARDAKKVAASSARGLMPADIGLLLHGPFVTLDFSTRPFDAIEFERMLSIMEQVVYRQPEGAGTF
jgi:hypothetical protein